MLFVCAVVALDAGGGLLGLFEALVLAVCAVLVLDHRSCLGHLLPVQVLKYQDNN